MYALANDKNLYLMMVDGNAKDYSFTNEIRLAMKFESEQEAQDKRRKLPMLKNLKVIHI